MKVTGRVPPRATLAIVVGGETVLAVPITSTKTCIGGKE